MFGVCPLIILLLYTRILVPLITLSYASCCVSNIVLTSFHPLSIEEFRFSKSVDILEFNTHYFIEIFIVQLSRCPVTIHVYMYIRIGEILVKFSFLFFWSTSGLQSNTGLDIVELKLMYDTVMSFSAAISSTVSLNWLYCESTFIRGFQVPLLQKKKRPVVDSSILTNPIYKFPFRLDQNFVICQTNEYYETMILAHHYSFS